MGEYPLLLKKFRLLLQLDIREERLGELPAASLTGFQLMCLLSDGFFQVCGRGFILMWLLNRVVLDTS